MFIFSLFNFELAAIKLRARNKFLQICYRQRCQITSEIQTFNNISFFYHRTFPSTIELHFTLLK